MDFVLVLDFVFSLILITGSIIIGIILNKNKKSKRNQQLAISNILRLSTNDKYTYVLNKVFTQFICQAAPPIKNNKYAIIDAYVFTTHIISSRINNARLTTDDDHNYKLHLIAGFGCLLCEKYNIDIDEIEKISKKRNAFIGELFKEHNGSVNMNTFITELINIINYDTTYNRYVKYTLDSPLVVTDFMSSLKLRNTFSDYFENLDTLLDEIFAS